MAVKLIFAPESALDIDAAYAWYEQQRVGLGEEFLTCLEAKLESVCRAPSIHEFVYKSFRRALIRRFPYQAFYEFDRNTVTVFCVFHSSQDPDKWKERLDGVRNS